MKKVLSISLLFCLAVLFVRGYSDLIKRRSSAVGDVVSAVETGRASQIARFFGDRVDITIHKKTTSYSRSQAEVVLRDFFHNNAVKAFLVLNKGSNNGSKFCIGDLRTQNGDFRTTLYMKSRSKQQVLQEIRLDEGE